MGARRSSSLAVLRLVLFGIGLADRNIRGQESEGGASPRPAFGTVALLLLAPEKLGPGGRLEDESGIDLDPRERDPLGGPLAREDKRSRWRQRPDPVLGVVAAVASAAASLHKHGACRPRPGLAGIEITKRIEVGRLRAVRKLKPEAKELGREVPAGLVERLERLEELEAPRATATLRPVADSSPERQELEREAAAVGEYVTIFTATSSLRASRSCTGTTPGSAFAGGSSHGKPRTISQASGSVRRGGGSKKVTAFSFSSTPRRRSTPSEKNGRRTAEQRAAAPGSSHLGSDRLLTQYFRGGGRRARWHRQTLETPKLLAELGLSYVLD